MTKRGLLIIISMYVAFCLFVIYGFITITIPSVGLDYVLDNWIFYAMAGVGGAAYIAIFSVAPALLAYDIFRREQESER